MNKTKVRKDKHGLYFRAGGYLFRPTESSQFAADEPVKARHIGGTMMGKIKRFNADYNETWSCHGRYIDYDEEAGKTVFLNSEDLFNAGKD